MTLYLVWQTVSILPGWLLICQLPGFDWNRKQNGLHAIFVLLIFGGFLALEPLAQDFSWLTGVLIFAVPVHWFFQFNGYFCATPGRRGMGAARSAHEVMVARNEIDFRGVCAPGNDSLATQHPAVSPHARARKVLRSLLGEWRYLRFIHQGHVTTRGPSGRIWRFSRDGIHYIWCKRGHKLKICHANTGESERVPDEDRVAFALLYLRSGVDGERELIAKGGKGSVHCADCAEARGVAWNPVSRSIDVMEFSHFAWDEPNNRLAWTMAERQRLANAAESARADRHIGLAGSQLDEYAFLWLLFGAGVMAIAAFL